MVVPQNRRAAQAGNRAAGSDAVSVKDGGIGRSAIKATVNAARAGAVCMPSLLAPASQKNPGASRSKCDRRAVGGECSRPAQDWITREAAIRVAVSMRSIVTATLRSSAWNFEGGLAFHRPATTAESPQRGWRPLFRGIDDARPVRGLPLFRRDAKAVRIFGARPTGASGRELHAPAALTTTRAWMRLESATMCHSPESREAERPPHFST